MTAALPIRWRDIPRESLPPEGLPVELNLIRLGAIDGYRQGRDYYTADGRLIEYLVLQWRPKAVPA